MGNSKNSNVLNIKDEKILLTAIQLSSCSDVKKNLTVISKQLSLLTQAKPNYQHIVVLPECCLFFGAKDTEQLSLAKKSSMNDQLVTDLAAIAQRFQVFLIAGSIPIITSNRDKFTNSSCIFSPTGNKLAQYDKIHLFDVEVTDNTQSYCESRFTQAGQINDNITIVDTVLANIGLTICFDLRFPQLFQQLAKKGADIITVPSAFTKVTGKAHWQTLLQARAIENQVYIIAAGQEGVHENGRETWGHSMIISPWGEILACLPHGEGYISTEYNAIELNNIRQRMPLISPI
jgi:predicted amidohydrolase